MAVRQRKTGWQVFVWGPADPITGDRQRQYAFAKTKREAERMEARMVADRDAGRWANAGTLTVAEYAAEWLQRQRSELRPSTWRRYGTLMEHTLREIGNVKLRELKRVHVQRVVDGAVGRGLAPQTVTHVFRVLHAMLADAHRKELIAANPASGRKVIDRPRVEEPKLRVPTDDEVSRILQVVAGTTLEAPVVLAVTTGMRRAELCGLRWRYVDLEGGVAQVVEALHNDVDGRPILTNPKTERSRRAIPLSPETVAFLRRHRKRQHEQRLLLGAAWQDHDLVVAQADGTPVNPDDVSHQFIRLTAKLGIGCRLHDLRHHHATSWLARGVPVKVVSERLGHTSIAFTLKTYAHCIPTMQAEAVRVVDDAFGQVLASL